MFCFTFLSQIFQDWIRKYLQINQINSPINITIQPPTPLEVYNLEVSPKYLDGWPEEFILTPNNDMCYVCYGVGEITDLKTTRSCNYCGGVGTIIDIKSGN